MVEGIKQRKVGNKLKNQKKIEEMELNLGKYALGSWA
jgi:hypothetical protein